MGKILDRVFCGLMALATLGHLFGTFKMVQPGTAIFAWSLAGVLAAALLTVLNFLRSGRPQDKALAGITLAGNLGWVVIVVLFGLSLGNLFDFRVVFHGVAAVGLFFFSLRTLCAK